MKIQVLLLFFIPVLFGTKMEKHILSSYERAQLIDELSHEAVGANCFCRLGNERGYEVGSYSNAYYDFGSLKYWNNFGATSGRRRQCYDLCRQKAALWLATKPNDFLCNLANKTSPFNIVAYSKVGGSPWLRTFTQGNIPCSSETDEYVDPCTNTVPDRYLDFNLQVAQNGGPIYLVNATPYCKVPAGWGYHWRVCEFNEQTGECEPNTELSMPDHWYTSDHSCSFKGYNGSAGYYNADAFGMFMPGKTYRIVFGVYGPNQEWVETRKYFNQNGLTN